MIDMVFLLLIFFIVNATAITVKMDKRVGMPTATSATEVKSANGSIVLNVYDPEKEGSFGPNIYWGTDDPAPLASVDALRKYIKEKAELFKRFGYDKDPGLSLYLRGDQKSIFKYSKQAIAVAAEEGIPNIMFATVGGKKSD